MRTRLMFGGAVLAITTLLVAGFAIGAATIGSVDDQLASDIDGAEQLFDPSHHLIDVGAYGNPPQVLAAVKTTAAVTPFVTFGPRTVRQLRSELEQADVDRRAAPVHVTGRVIDADGPVESATVQIGETRAKTDRNGEFVLDNIDRANQLMAVRALGYTSRTIGVVGDVEALVETIEVGDIALLGQAPSRFTMLFGGDSSLGRRFIDPAEVAGRDELPPDNPDAKIGLETAREDTLALLGDLEQIVDPYDLVTINLETVVTDNPIEPQLEQTYVLYTLPGSVDALADIGIDHVTLGNNHVWDYGELGVQDTHAALDAAGIAYSGSGASADEAFAPHIASNPNLDFDIALHSWVAIENLPEPYAPAATDTKGGGAYASDLARVTAEVAKTEAAGMLTIAIPHVGYEYTEHPAGDDGPHRSNNLAYDTVQNDTFVQDRLQAAVDGDPDLVVAHHPHIAQGFEMNNDILVAHSLGNLIFDQPRLDTLFGAMLAVAFDEQELAQARVEPIYIADFVPTIATGEPADQLLRRLAYFSAEELVLAPDATAAVVLPRDEATLIERTVDIYLEPDADGVAMIDLRDLRETGESIGLVDGAHLDSVSIGRDLMVLGDMEDHDFDADPEEIAPWNSGSAGFVCGSQARRGAGALCSTRTSTNEGGSTLNFGQRIRVTGDRINDPKKDLTLLMYERGVNRGEVTVNVSYRASQGSRQFGDEELVRLPARTGDYAMHWLDLNMPLDDPQFIESLPLDRPFRMRPQFRSARAVRLSVTHEPPADGTGLLALDDLALVSWEDPIVTDAGMFRTPSPMDFLRITEATAGQKVTITLHTYIAPPIASPAVD